jgi:hypothetical protein
MKCICGNKAPDLEDADWVIYDQTFCESLCYDKVVAQILSNQQNFPFSQKEDEEVFF